MKYTEENGVYDLDCTAAVWSTNQLHNIYQDSEHKYGNLNFLCDADFIIETESNIFIVEYKNASIAGAAKPGAFHPDNADKLTKVAHKFFDSFHYLYLMGKEKAKKYIYLLEYPAGNSSSRLMIRNKLKDYLPFKLQQMQECKGRKMIDEVKVVDIAEWNNDTELGKFPFQLKVKLGEERSDEVV